MLCLKMVVVWLVRRICRRLYRRLGLYVVVGITLFVLRAASSTLDDPVSDASGCGAGVYADVVYASVYNV